MRRIVAVLAVMAVAAAMAAAMAMPAFAGNIKGPEGGRPLVSGNLDNPSIFANHVFHDVGDCDTGVLVQNKNGPHGGCAR